MNLLSIVFNQIKFTFFCVIFSLFVLYVRAVCFLSSVFCIRTYVVFLINLFIFIIYLFCWWHNKQISFDFNSFHLFLKFLYDFSFIIFIIYTNVFFIVVTYVMCWWYKFSLKSLLVGGFSCSCCSYFDRCLP